MKALTLAFALALLPALATAHDDGALHPDALPAIEVSPGVILKELTGRSAPAAARSEKNSVAWFHLEPGRASAWSYNLVGEESFFILKGHGEVWTGAQAHAVGPGSYILVAPRVVRSIRATRGEVLEFYAVTAPAWSQDDDVLTQAPEGAPQ